MAFNFNGSTQFLTGTPPATAPPMAFSCWFRLSGQPASGVGTLISLSQSASPYHYFAFDVVATSLLIRCFTWTGGGGIATTSTAATIGAWHHAFCVFAGMSSRKVWLDGGGQGTNSDSRSLTPSVLHLGRTASPSFPHYFPGRLAEAAVWAGSGVENMGAQEAAVLAAGFSPLCLGERLSRLALFRPVIRDLNWPGIGPALTASGGPTVAVHPRAIYPAQPAAGPYHFPPFFAPYRFASAAAHADHVQQGWGAVAGAHTGQTNPLGEVSS